jgi:hypothetical protein
VKFQHMVKPLDFTAIDAGEILTKFIAKDESAEDYTVELHGFFDERGNFYITDEIVSKRKSAHAGENGNEN